MRASDGVLHILTSAQLVGSSPVLGSPVFQPASELGGGEGSAFPPTGDPIAVVSKWLIPSKQAPGLDAALAQVINENDVAPEIEGIGRLRGFGTVGPETPVLKVGAGTGLTYGVVVAISGFVRIEYAAGPELLGNSIMCTAMSGPGDAGAVLLDEDQRALGIIIAGNERMTIAVGIDKVLLALDVSLVT